MSAGSPGRPGWLWRRRRNHPRAHGPGPEKRWWTLAAMCCALFMAFLNTTVTGVALPSIQRELHASLSDLVWGTNAYALTFAVLLVTGGRMGDIYGRRRVFLVGVALFAVASAVIGVAGTISEFILARALLGVGAALMIPGTLSILTHAFPPRERGKAIGVWSGVSATALAAGPVLGGWLTQDVSWRAIFFLNVPVAAIAFVMTVHTVRESRDESAPRTLNVPSVVLITVGLGTVTFALGQGNEWGWSSVRVLGLLGLGIVAMARFILLQQRLHVPLVDLQAFRSRQFLGANIVGFLVLFASFSFGFFLALYLQNTLGDSPLTAGLEFLPMQVATMLGAPLAGWLSDKYHPRPVMTVGLLLAAASLLWLSRVTAGSGYGYILPTMIGMGAGTALVISPMSTAAMNSVDESKSGVAAGTLSMSRMVGGNFGVAVLGALVAMIGRTDLARSLPHTSVALRHRLVEGLGSNGQTIHDAAIRVAERHAFIDALSVGVTLAASAALLGAVVAWTLIRPATAKPREESTMRRVVAWRTRRRERHERRGDPERV